MFDTPPGRVYWRVLAQAAWRHRENSVQIPPGVLRLHLPERYSIAVAAIQQDKELVPELRALVETGSPAAEVARFALESMEKAAETRPTGAIGDRD